MHNGTKLHTDWELKCFICAANLNSEVDRPWALVSNAKVHAYIHIKMLSPPKPVGCEDTSLSKILESVFQTWVLYQMRKRLFKGASEIFNKGFRGALVNSSVANVRGSHSFSAT